MPLPLVLLPGMMCDARLFAPQIAAFSATRAVHVPPLTDHDTTGALAAEILAHAPPRFALAGLSMGGIVAMEIMALAPDRVDRLALLDTNPRAELPEVRARRASQIAAAQKGDLMRVMRDEMKPNYLAPGPAQAAILDLCMDMAMALRPQVFIRQSRALRDRPDRRDTLRGISVPTLLLCGADDRLCPVSRHAEMQALIPHARLAVIAGAGHLPVLEQPAATTAALAAWL
jgi:pimeloyl-ACP methyl ester carboxylesterase